MENSELKRKILEIIEKGAIEQLKAYLDTIDIAATSQMIDTSTTAKETPGYKLYTYNNPWRPKVVFKSKYWIEWLDNNPFYTGLFLETDPKTGKEVVAMPALKGVKTTPPKIVPGEKLPTDTDWMDFFLRVQLEITSIQEANEDLKKQVSNYKKREKLKDESSRERITEKSNKITELLKELEEKQKRHDKLLESIEEFNKKLKEEKDESVATPGTIHFSGTERMLITDGSRKDLQDEVNLRLQLEQELQDIEDEYRDYKWEAENDLWKKDDRITELDRELKKAEDELVIVEKERDDYQTKLEEWDKIFEGEDPSSINDKLKILKKIEEDLEKKEQQINRQKSEIVQLTESRDEWKDRVILKGDDSSDLQIKLDKNQESLNRAIEKIDEKTREINKLNQDFNKKVSDNSKLENQLAVVKGERDKLVEKVKEVSEEKVKVENEKNDLKIEYQRMLNDLKVELDTQKREIAKLKKKPETRDTSTQTDEIKKPTMVDMDTQTDEVIPKDESSIFLEQYLQMKERELEIYVYAETISDSEESDFQKFDWESFIDTLSSHDRRKWEPTIERIFSKYHDMLFSFDIDEEKKKEIIKKLDEILNFDLLGHLEIEQFILENTRVDGDIEIILGIRKVYN